MIVFEFLFGRQNRKKVFGFLFRWQQSSANAKVIDWKFINKQIFGEEMEQTECIPSRRWMIMADLSKMYVFHKEEDLHSNYVTFFSVWHNSGIKMLTESWAAVFLLQKYTLIKMVEDFCRRSLKKSPSGAWLMHHAFIEIFHN